MKKSRILFVSPTAAGGSAVVLYNVARLLERNSFEPIVFFIKRDSDFIPRELSKSGIEVIVGNGSNESVPLLKVMIGRYRNIRRYIGRVFGVKAEGFYLSVRASYRLFTRDLRLILRIYRIIRDRRIDLVHLNSGLIESQAGIVGATLAKVPCICHVHMFAELSGFDKMFWRFVGCLVYISQAIADNYSSQGIPRERGIIVHNGVDMQIFSLPTDPCSIRKELGWTSGEKIVGVIGRLVSWKGHEFFLEAMAKVTEEIPSARALIVGEPEKCLLNEDYYSKLLNLTRTLGLKDKVSFAGFREDVPDIISALDVVVLSSSSPEPFGLVVIEAMAASKAVVATAAGGVLDIIQNGENGLLVPCRNSPAMAEAIKTLLLDPEKSRRMGRRAKSHIKMNFTLERQVQKVQKIYRDILTINRTTEHPSN